MDMVHTYIFIHLLCLLINTFFVLTWMLTVLVADYGNHCYRRILSNERQQVLTIAGNRTPGYNDGGMTVASFNSPWGITSDLNRVVYCTDAVSHRIRRVQGGVTTTISGVGGKGSHIDGALAHARFNSPRGIVTDYQGAVYVADCDNHRYHPQRPNHFSFMYM
jgi:hypothetical protein